MLFRTAAINDCNIRIVFSSSEYQIRRIMCIVWEGCTTSLGSGALRLLTPFGRILFSLFKGRAGGGGGVVSTLGQM